ncbi:MAG: PIN domain-containing protein [Treponema sp.]|jgi:predicted nucleic acid-binding protein|nr:PIN domain-containing protein [Treponema sp.]
MKICFDTNIVIDILEKREPFFKDSYAAFLMAAKRKIEGIIGASAVTDIYYSVRKSRKSKRDALADVIDLFNTLTVVDTTRDDIHFAAVSEMTDFEDAVSAAEARREGAGYIIIRNTGDFINSPVPAILPGIFLTLV